MNITKAWRRDGFASLETLFHVANGYLGVRASAADDQTENVDSIRGAYVNGFYEIEDIQYGEKLYGFPDTKQVLVNLPDAQTVRLYAGGKRLFPLDGEERSQTLALKKGLSVRSAKVETPDGKHLLVQTERMASFHVKELFLLRYRVTSVDYSGEIGLCSTLNADVTNHAAKGDPRVAATPLKCLNVLGMELARNACAAFCQTRRSGLGLCVRAAHQCRFPSVWTKTDTACEESFTGGLQPGESVELVKYAVYADSLRHADAEADSCRILNECMQMGADALMERQQVALSRFWAQSRACIDGDPESQQALDFDLFELLQSAGHDGVSNVAAKGLSGEGYEGHTFWDSEIYVFPFFLWTNPDIAKGMLAYRYHILDGARKNARLLGLERGALYPWRTICGDECSAFFPAGAAQYHINGDVAHAFLSYYRVTGDLDFMARMGAEVLVETARVWLKLGHMADDGFRIDCVTGPDEYTCVVNNNFYTNAAAQSNLAGAAEIMERLTHAGLAGEVIRKTGVTEGELTAMREAAARMYLPHDDALGVSAQDDSFLQKKRLDLSSIPKEGFPLLLHYHPLFLYRHQVCKQADTVLAHLLFPATADAATKERSFDYYAGVTTHDSSLSKCVFGIMAARLGRTEQALEYFRDTVGLDLNDSHGNTRDGLHTAGMGGAYLCVLQGFAGLAVEDGMLSFAPRLPKEWTGYRFPLQYRGRRLLFEMTKDGARVELLEGEPVTVRVNGADTRLVR